MRTIKDFEIINSGSVIMVYPQNEGAEQWINDNVSLEDWQWFGGGFAVDPHYIEDLCYDLSLAGFIL